MSVQVEYSNVERFQTAGFSDKTVQPKIVVFKTHGDINKALKIFKLL